MTETSHNVDQYMSDLRQILAQGKKRIGILLGAGAPASINISTEKDKYTPLIPAIEELTKLVTGALSENEKKVLGTVTQCLPTGANIEIILSKIRALSTALHGYDNMKMGEYNQTDYDDLAKSICKHIGDAVKCKLPFDNTPYHRLASWINGTDRDHAVEIFTSNYDLLMEEALETGRIPFFCGFSGSHEPFFDAASISNNDDLPARWARLWKLHGSLGWKLNAKKELILGGGRDANELIYPDHMKYDHIQKLPYTALFERLRKFLSTPDTLLLSCGFSYADAHIYAGIDEALSANPSASVFAFLYQDLKKEEAAERLALNRPNFSAYACDKAAINCMTGKWELGQNQDNKDWINIRKSFWGTRGTRDQLFTLGDFGAFADFFAYSKSDLRYSAITPPPKASGS